MITIKCRKCGELKTSGKVCKTCKKNNDAKYYQANKDRIKYRVKIWTSNNQDKFTASQRAHKQRQRTKDRQNEYSRKRYKSDPNRRISYKQNWYKLNIERVRDRLRNWRLNNSEQTSIQSSIRRDRIIGTPNNLTILDWEEIKELSNHRCIYCLKTSKESNMKKFHKEHIIPVSKGGGITRYNIVPSCVSCNSTKCNYNLVVAAKRIGINYDELIYRINTLHSNLMKLEENDRIAADNILIYEAE